MYRSGHIFSKLCSKKSKLPRLYNGEEPDEAAAIVTMAEKGWKLHIQPIVRDEELNYRMRGAAQAFWGNTSLKLFAKIFTNEFFSPLTSA